MSNFDNYAVKPRGWGQKERLENREIKNNTRFLNSFLIMKNCKDNPIGSVNCIWTKFSFYHSACLTCNSFGYLTSKIPSNSKKLARNEMPWKFLNRAMIQDVYSILVKINLTSVTVPVTLTRVDSWKMDWWINDCFVRHNLVEDDAVNFRIDGLL